MPTSPLILTPGTYTLTFGVDIPSSGIVSVAGRTQSASATQANNGGGAAVFEGYFDAGVKVSNGATALSVLLPAADSASLFTITEVGGAGDGNLTQFTAPTNGDNGGVGATILTSDVVELSSETDGPDISVNTGVGGLVTLTWSVGGRDNIDSLDLTTWPGIYE